MRLKRIHNIINIVAVFTVTMFFSCNNNYKQVQNLGISENEPIGVAENINFKHTDSGRVMANLLSPKRLDFSNRDFPYEEFPDGILLYVYDDESNKSIIISDYAISYKETSLIDLQGNVKIITNTNDTLFTEQLYFDENKKWVFTNQPVRFRQGLDVINGNGFDSNKDFTNAEVLEVTGMITLDE